MAKAKSGLVQKILSAVCLVLSLLLFTTMFMPTYGVISASGEKNAMTLSTVEILQGSFMSDEETAQALIDSMNPLLSEAEREKALKLITARSLGETEDAASYGASILFSIGISVLGLIGAIVSLIALLRKGPGMGTIILSFVTTVVGVILMIVSYTALDQLAVAGTRTMNVGAGVWVALVSTIAVTACAITGKVLRKK